MSRNELDIGDDLDRSFEISLEEVKKRTISGIVAIMGRGFFLNLVAQVSQFFLLAILTVEQMGVFWVVSAAVGFLIFFSDIGLAAALIQKKQKPTREDLRTTFTIQQGLVVALLITLYFAAPFIQRTYGLSQEGVLLLYALGISLLLSSLKSIPSVLLERKLAFGRFILPDILESLVFSISVVIFASQGLGIRSFTYAVVLRSIVGLVAMYILQPWMPGIAFSMPALKDLVKFGIPYQFNTLLAVIKDRGATLAIGAVVGTQGVGFLGTAERASQVPLRLFMDPTTKVTFPAFARMQGNGRELARSVTKALLFVTFFVYPSVVGLWLLAPVIIDVLPQYQKWEPSLIPLGFMTASVLFAAPTTLLTNLLMAIGKIKTVSKLLVMWTVLTVLLVPGLGALYGINGAAAGHALVSSTSVIAIYIAKKHVNFSLTDSLLRTAVSTVLMGALVLVLRESMDHNSVNLVAIIMAGGAVYLALSYFLIGQMMVKDGKKILRRLISK